ncbi:hypothetical protein HELRODRAFT_73178 [Helobdella robusta]|uniref:PDEase domain-containing protein n=1 Tax=Helobdella robusta TaxID=6412 RepID=T1G1B3_HELRO|nr:hypothetical protein HELRODRAFT_73178 [Helobdella robusta]ESO10008.1 hypothetical protein HELRODRAFT_73178 [Helobdella robusta]
MQKLDDWAFNVFELNLVTNKPIAFRYVARALLNKFDFLTKYKIQKACLENFIVAMEEGYRKHNNSYHNDIHAADVAQTVNSVISQTELKACLTDSEIFATLFAAIIHDYEHTGTTNSYHVNTESDLALLYNDRAVLENFHVSQVFRKMKENKTINVVANMDKNEFSEFRINVIEIVLATDMSNHFSLLKNLQAAMTQPDSLTMLQYLCALVHFADISHPSKPWEIHTQWTTRLFDEFFVQGDREKQMKIPVSPLCDRNNTMLPASQIGFLDYIVIPTVNLIFDVIPIAVKTRLDKMPENNLQMSSWKIEMSMLLLMGVVVCC